MAQLFLVLARMSFVAGTQLELRLRNPPSLDIDGYVDSRGIRYIGVATQQIDGTWRSLAEVGGALCLVEVTITMSDNFPEGLIGLENDGDRL